MNSAYGKFDKRVLTDILYIVFNINSKHPFTAYFIAIIGAQKRDKGLIAEGKSF
ncbi:MAG: hypothetical protein GX554_02560 [Elusimicrobia bacterium]|nr:hypothetical protein [Elusimicrobiota bacterium]